MSGQVRDDIKKVLKSEPDAEMQVDELVSELAGEGHEEKTILRTIRNLVGSGKLSFSRDGDINGEGKVYTTGLVEPSEATVLESEDAVDGIWLNP